MKIGPANSTAPLIKDKQEAAKKINQTPEKEENRKAKEDQLNISDRAKELQSALETKADYPAEIENSREKKLNLVRLKISKRFYDKPQIKTKIAEKISGDKDILREYYKSIY